jgi:hypothetical protein
MTSPPLENRWSIARLYGAARAVVRQPSEAPRQTAEPALDLA